MSYKEFDYVIGIDPGVNTGFAVWDIEDKKIISIFTQPAIFTERLILFYRNHGKKIFVRFEDARLRKWFGNAGREKLQGAGSIKRDCQRWEEFLTYYKIPFESVPPKNNKTKMPAKTFQQLTKWQGRTDEHGRDAAMLIFGL